MLCPVCQKSNAETNSFCGNCGHPLASNQMPSNYPREGFEEIEEPEIHQIDPRIPANEYTRPRVTAQRESQEPAESSLSRAIKASETPRAEEPARPASTSRSSTSIFGLDEMEPPKYETDPYSVKPVSSSMFDFDPAAAERSSQSIHGPSFLGLSDPDFLDEEEEEPSHARRNWLLAALAIVVVIGAVQWRNIRDTGMQYAGTMHFNLPLKKGSGQAQVAPEKAAPTESGETSAAAEGKPEMDVNPTANGANSGTNQGAAGQPKSGEENLLTASSDKSNPPSDSKDSSSKATTSNTKSSDAKSQPSTTASSKSADKSAAPANDAAKNAAAKSDADSTDAADSADTSKVADAAPAPTKADRSARAKRAAAKDATPKPVPGADDLAHAYSASDPATAANWLWAATKKGNKEAPVLLADYYAKGRGVPKDCEQATVLLSSAARAGNPRASARLGMYYAVGECVAQDRPQAWHWLSVAHQTDPGSDWVEQYRRQLWSQMTPDERARSGSGPTASE